MSALLGIYETVRDPGRRRLGSCLGIAILKRELETLKYSENKFLKRILSAIKFGGNYFLRIILFILCKILANKIKNI
jgi:hypothetical protein